MLKSNLIVDLSNLVFVTHYSLLKKTNNDFDKDYLIFNVIQSIKYYAMMYKVDGILVACDSPNVWRRNVFPEYKKNRDDLRDPYYDDVKEVIILLKTFFNEYTSIPAISVEHAEADDIIAVACQTSRNHSVIISSDKDFVQLIDEKTVLYSPSQKKERTSDDKEYELFEKCIRGDRGDNIPSAYPRIRKTKLEKAFHENKNGNPYEMLNIMETVKDNKKVSEQYNLNRTLIDLTLQPDEIRNDIEEKLKNISTGQFNHLKILKFLKEHRLLEVKDEFMRNKHIFSKTYIHN